MHRMNNMELINVSNIIFALDNRYGYPLNIYGDDGNTCFSAE